MLFNRMTNPQIQKIQDSIQILRNEIIHHKLYSVIDDIEDLKIFMKHHVFAVWDFMSLLKSLQNNLTCTTIPWIPIGNANTRYLINEIVVGEESDLDQFGNRMSHFELYLQSMKQCGAESNQIGTFLETLMQNKNLQVAFDESNVPESVEDFVNFTFSVIQSNKPHLMAAVFTFGREDLIPGMFISMIEDIYKRIPNSISIFKYYLERHIEIDGDHHSHLALEMTSNLCGNDESLWAEASEYTKLSLQHRIGLWNGAYDEIMLRKS
jgi:hypothetical protein